METAPATDFSPLLLTQMGSLYITLPSLFDYVADPEEQQFLADALFERVTGAIYPSR